MGVRRPSRRSRLRWIGICCALVCVIAPSLAQVSPAGAAPANPLAGVKWVPNSPAHSKAEELRRQGQAADADLLDRLVAPYQFAQWVGDWFTAALPDKVVGDLIDPTYAQGGVPILALYNLPTLNCTPGRGAADNAAYAAWIARIVRIINERKAIILLEPDGATVTYCFTDVGNQAALQARYDALKTAIGLLKNGHPNTFVYLDGGTHVRNTPKELTTVLADAGVAGADGFFLNSTTYEYTTLEVAFGRDVVQRLAAVGIPGKHILVDTSRNGLGPFTGKDDGGNREWCNAPGRALGTAPTTKTGNPLVDAFIWIKPIWQSDDDCKGDRSEPGPGQEYWSYALKLVQNSQHPFTDTPTDPEAMLAVDELTRRGIIRGNGDGTFGTEAHTLRAQMAALLARPLYWDLEDWGDVTFPDQGPVDRDLWRNVRTLAHYGVAKGYADGTYNPTGDVLYQQVILFISRAMVQQHYWTLQPDQAGLYPNLPADSARAKEDRQYVATYVYYTTVVKDLGGVPGRPASGAFVDYDQPAPRWWFAVALYRALLSTPNYLGD